MKYSLITKAVNKVEVVCVCFINFKSKVCILKDPNYNVKRKNKRGFKFAKISFVTYIVRRQFVSYTAGAAAILKEQSPRVFFKIWDNRWSMNKFIVGL